MNVHRLIRLTVGFVVDKTGPDALDLYTRIRLLLDVLDEHTRWPNNSCAHVEIP